MLQLPAVDFHVVSAAGCCGSQPASQTCHVLQGFFHLHRRIMVLTCWGRRITAATGSVRCWEPAEAKETKERATLQTCLPCQWR
ncbi:hypothetical protein AV530_018163 [Patagioenas fasciata monilis]|uniref:Uncharacterized protein n=1 Tax=Patagioenas fasciata monilis TaxID=372326 RepID=A0A1V4KL07_PATFA|nr:hypothetical protein AV530_018163 [Patagioenas fasciata monilis]